MSPKIAHPIYIEDWNEVRRNGSLPPGRIVLTRKKTKSRGGASSPKFIAIKTVIAIRVDLTDATPP